MQIFLDRCARNFTRRSTSLATKCYSLMQRRRRDHKEIWHAHMVMRPQNCSLFLTLPQNSCTFSRGSRRPTHFPFFHSIELALLLAFFLYVNVDQVLACSTRTSGSGACSLRNTFANGRFERARAHKLMYGVSENIRGSRIKFKKI